MLVNVLSICSDDELEPADAGDPEDADIDGMTTSRLIIQLSFTRHLSLNFSYYLFYDELTVFSKAVYGRRFGTEMLAML